MCRNDIRKLGMSRYMTINIMNKDNLIQEQLQKLADSSPEAYTTENIEDICGAIDKLNDEIKLAADGLQLEIVSKEKEVQEILEQAIKEDSAYHAEYGE